ncbi:MAG: hypothetical protein KGZ63_11470 [Clostridiales bacterium]|jgi:hypothetical protein|nr:hypothetical protein [Clostridiales bacterium]
MYELKDFGERMKTLVMFEPFFQLRINQKHNEKYKKYDIVAIGFALLIHLAETTMNGRPPCSFNDIRAFFDTLIRNNYHQVMSDEETMDMAYYFLDILQNNGRDFQVTYQDLETATVSASTFNLIEAKSDDSYSDIRYRLSNTGLEFLFKSREISKELRMTVAQIYFHQQIERGVFSGALKSVRDMEMQVDNQSEEWEREQQRLARNIKQFDPDMYSEREEKMYDQFNKEAEMFQTLQNLLAERVDEFRSRTLTEKEQQSLNQLLDIKNSLNRVINKHNLLLSFKMGFDGWIIKAMADSVVSSFLTRVDFYQEFIIPILQNDPPLTDVGKVLAPLFPKKQKRTFNLMRAFEPQQLPKDVDDGEDEPIPIPTEEDYAEAAKRDKVIMERQNRKFLEYISLFLTPLHQGHTRYSLKEVLKTLHVKHYARVIGEVDFYAFVVRMHQLTAIPLSIDSEIKKTAVLSSDDNLIFLLIKYVEAHPELAYLQQAIVYSDEEELVLPNGCRITNFYIVADQKGEEKLVRVL